MAHSTETDPLRDASIHMFSALLAAQVFHADFNCDGPRIHVSSGIEVGQGVVSASLSCSRTVVRVAEMLLVMRYKVGLCTLMFKFLKIETRDESDAVGEFDTHDAQYCLQTHPHR